MEDYKKVALAVLGLLIVGGGIFLAIYVVQGGNGESENIPGSPEVVLTPLM